jgi:plastocyanin
MTHALLCARLFVATALAGCGLLGPAPLAATVEARASSEGRYEFVPGRLVLPPQTAVAITLLNSSDAPHTLVMLDPIGRRTDVIVEPGERDTLQLTTPGPGAYRFVCTVHEDMAGTLVVEDGALP